MAMCWLCVQRTGRASFRSFAKEPWKNKNFWTQFVTFCCPPQLKTVLLWSLCFPSAMIPHKSKLSLSQISKCLLLWAQRVTFARVSVVEDEEGGSRFGYRIAVVDLDPKPVENIPYWYNLDQQIIEHFMQEIEEKSSSLHPLPHCLAAALAEQP